MAKSVRDGKLDSRTAREKLKPAGKPYYRAIDEGLHLGYRKGKAGGKWVMRRYVGDEKYVVETIGTADDRLDADGAEILTFHQAQGRARELAASHREGANKSGGPMTVSRVLDAYLDQMDAQQSKTAIDSRNRIEKHIRPRLGAIPAAELTREKIAAWLKALADTPRQVRGKKGKASRSLAKPQTEDERRRRRASANRTLTILRAALSHAYRDGKIASDTEWRRVQPFAEVDAPRVRYFTQDEVRRLVNAAQGDFRTLVNAALFTGCRYGELGRLQIGDFNPDAGTVFVGQSKSGKARHVVLTEEGQTFFRQLVAGRATDALMLTKADGSAWGASHQLRPMAEACKAARVAHAGFHILRHTAASHNVMGGVPLPIVARNLGHADSRMTEKHYAHLAPSYVADTLRKYAPTFGTVETTAVVPLDRARG